MANSGGVNLPLMLVAGLESGVLLGLAVTSVPFDCFIDSFCLKAMEITHALILATLGMRPLQERSPRRVRAGRSSTRKTGAARTSRARSVHVSRQRHLSRHKSRVVENKSGAKRRFGASARLH